MSITRDQQELRERNRTFLENYISGFFGAAFEKLQNEYLLKIEQNVFDPSDKEELKQYLKKEFEETIIAQPGRLLEKVEVKNKTFSFELEEIKSLGSYRELLDTIYPSLQNSLTDGYYPAAYLNFKKSLDCSAKLVYLKHLNTSINIQPKKIFSETESGIFKTPLDEEFFKDCIKEDEVKINRTYVSCLYAVTRFKRMGKYEFALYWNIKYSHLLEIQTYPKRKAGLDPIVKHPILTELEERYKQYKKDFN